MRRLIALVVITTVAMAAVFVARRTAGDDVRRAAAASPGGRAATTLPVLDSGPAPSLAAATGWLNTEPLLPAALAGKVVLYDFWTFDCVNCKHTLPWVKAWQARYAADGLVLASVHTPEFDYEADPSNVARAVASNNITYPVALDPHNAIWRAFDNHYWPAFYLYDGQGRLRLKHFGEGAYDTTEDAIRTLLGVRADAPRAAVPAG